MRAAEAPVSAATVPLLIQAIGEPNGSVSRVAQVVSGDAGLAARVLALANSAAFGFSRQVTEIGQAVSLVGSNMCQTMAIAGSCDLLDGSTGLPNAAEHAIAMGCMTRSVATRSHLNGADAFAAGLLHDLGEILLWRMEPDAYSVAHQEWATTEDQLRGERGMFGTDHALAAREQLASWNLPGVVVDAVGDHHRPDMHHQDVSTAVVVAEELLDEHVGWTARCEVFGIGRDDAEGIRLEAAEHAADMTQILIGA